jgi:hypothetical protein
MAIELTITIILCSFLTGLIAGVVITTYGFKLGFKASYQIRATISGEEQPDTLLNQRQDPAEFDLLDKEEPGQ